MFGNNPTLRFPGNLMQVRSINELRGVSPYEMNDEAAILVTGSGLFTFDASSLANDNGKTVIRPDGFTPLQSGRWVQSGAQTAENTFSTVLALQGSGLSVAYLVGDPNEADGLFTGVPGSLVRQNATGIASTVRPTVEKGLIDIFDRGAGTSGIMEKSLSRAGAVGNGIAIDTDAIQDAVSEIEYNTRFDQFSSNTPYLGAGEVTFPQGLFLVDDAIKITRSLRMVGEGNCEYSSGARIQQQTASRDLFRVEPIAQGASIALDNMVLRANGGGGSGGSLVNVTYAAGQCNTIRIRGCLFATPQNKAINIQRGDDVLIQGNLFDVTALECLAFGTGAASDFVTNVRVIDNDFYGIAVQCILAYNLDGFIASQNTIWSPSRTAVFFEGIDTLPYQLRNINIANNTFEKVNQIVRARSAQGLVIIGNNGDGLGTTNKPLIEVTRGGPVLGSDMQPVPTSGLAINGNFFSGNTGTAPFYESSGGDVVDSAIGGNVFKATGGTNGAFKANTTMGGVLPNSATGFAVNSIGHRWSTGGSSVNNIGTLTPGQTKITTITPVIGTVQGDSIRVEPVDFGGFPDGVFVRGKVSAAETLTITYTNMTTADIAVPAHDISVLATR